MKHYKLTKEQCHDKMALTILDVGDTVEIICKPDGSVHLPKIEHCDVDMFMDSGLMYLDSVDGYQWSQIAVDFACRLNEAAE